MCSLRGQRTKGREGREGRGKLKASAKRDESAKRDCWDLVGNNRLSTSN